jgi:hypothetical protein
LLADLLHGNIRGLDATFNLGTDEFKRFIEQLASGLKLARCEHDVKPLWIREEINYTGASGSVSSTKPSRRFEVVAEGGQTFQRKLAWDSAI